MDCLEECTRWSPCCLLFNRTVSCKCSLQPTSHQQLKNLYNPFNLIPFLEVPFNLPFKLNHQLPILELNYTWIPVVMSSQVLSSISIIFRQLKYVTWSKILRGYPRYSISGENHLPGEFADKKHRITGGWFQPLWKIWKSIGIIIPNIWEKKKFMFQTTNQIITINISHYK